MIDSQFSGSTNTPVHIVVDYKSRHRHNATLWIFFFVLQMLERKTLLLQLEFLRTQAAFWEFHLEKRAGRVAERKMFYSLSARGDGRSDTIQSRERLKLFRQQWEDSSLQWQSLFPTEGKSNPRVGDRFARSNIVIIASQKDTIF